jgi:hypothetical protein
MGTFGGVSSPAEGSVSVKVSRAANISPLALDESFGVDNKTLAAEVVGLTNGLLVKNVE